MHHVLYSQACNGLVLRVAYLSTDTTIHKLSRLGVFSIVTECLVVQEVKDTVKESLIFACRMFCPRHSSKTTWLE